MQKKGYNKGIAVMVVILTVIGLLLPREAKGVEKWTKQSGVWYVLYNKSESSSDGTKSGTVYDIYTPSANSTCNITWSAKKSKFIVAGSVTFYVDAPNGTRRWHTDLETDYDKSGSGTCTIPSAGVTTFKLGWDIYIDKRPSTQNKTITASIPVPTHCNVSTSSLTCATVGINGKSSTSIDFVSFCTGNNSAGITIKKKNNSGAFKLGTDNNTAQTATICGGTNRAYVNNTNYIDNRDNISNTTIYFNPTSFGTFNETIQVYNGQSLEKEIPITGTCTPEYTWTTNTTMASGDVLSGTNVASINGYNGTIYYESDDRSVIQVLDGNDNVLTTGKGVKIRAIMAGTANITASVDGSTVTSTKTFTVTNLGVQVIDWTQDLLRLKIGTTASPMSLTAVARDRDSGTATGCAITYSSNNASVVTVSGNQLTLVGAGEATLTASAVASSNYASATTARQVKVKAAGDNSCTEFALEQDKQTGVGTQSFNGKTPDKLSFTAEWVTNATGTSYIRAYDANNNKLADLYSITYTGKSWAWSEKSESQSNIQVPENATYIKFEGDLDNNKYYTNVKVTQLSYLRSAINGNTYSFGTQGVGTSHTESITAAKYSNLNDAITATITGANANQFTVNDPYYGNGCGDYGTASFSVTYNPTTSGDHTATLHLAGKISNQDVSVDITLTGKGTKLQQTITWADQAELKNLNANTTKPDNGSQTKPITLNASTDAVHGTEHLVITYTSSAPSIADVAGDKLYIYKAGTVTITASQAGDETYEAASVNVSKTLVIAHATPNLTWKSQMNNSTPVFSTQRVEAETTDNEGGISYSISGDAMSSISGDQVSLRNCLPITVTATKAQTDVYSGTSISYTFTPAKVTPTVGWSGGELTGKTFQVGSLSLSALTGSITNTNGLWHDIVVCYSSSDGNVAELNGDHFDLKDEGVCTITAYVPEGDNNNVSSNSVSYQLNVTKSALDFGSVTVGNRSEDETVNLSHIYPENSVTHYKVYTSSDNYRIMDGGAYKIVRQSDNRYFDKSDNLRIRFYPQTATTSTEYLYIENGTSKYTIALNGVSSWDDFSFATAIGTAEEKSFDISRLDGTFTVVSSNPSEFRVYDTDEGMMNTALGNLTGNVSEVNIKFYPESATAVNGNITVTNTTAAGDVVVYNIEASGTGSMGTYNCGEFTIGEFGHKCDVSMSGFVSANGYEITSNNPSVFRLNGSNTPKVTVGNGGTFTVNFYPMETKVYQYSDDASNSVTIRDLTTQKEYVVQLYGKANDRVLNFGNSLKVGDQSAVQTVQFSGVDVPTDFEVRSTDPTSFRINGQASSQAAENGTNYNIQFAPQHVQAYDEKIVLYEKTTGLEYPITSVSGTCSQKCDLTVTWVQNGQITLNVNEAISTLITNNKNATLTPTFTITQADQYVVYDSDNNLFIGYANGTASVSVTFSAQDNADYDITLSPTSTATINVTNLTAKIISWNTNLEYLRYDSQGTGQTSADVELNATVVDKNGSAISGQTITYTLSNVTNNAVSIVTSNSKKYLHVQGIGSAVLTINTPAVEGQYLEGTSVRQVNVTEYTNSCDGSAFVINDGTEWQADLSSQEEKTYNINRSNVQSAPAKHIAIHCSTTGTSPYATFTAKLVYADGSMSDAVITHTKNNGTFDQTLTYTVPSANRDIKGVYVKWTSNFIGGWSVAKTHVYSVVAKQASYFEQNTGSVTFGTQEVNFATSQNANVNYSALHSNIHAEVSGADASSFSVPEYTSVNNCTEFGTMAIPVTFKPMHPGSCTATLTLTGSTDDNENVTITIPLSGTGKKRVQTLTWATNQQKSGQYKDRATKIKLSATTDAIQLQGESPLSVSYSVDNPSIATVSEESDGWYLTMKEPGTVVVTASQAGDAITESASITMPFTVNKDEHVITWNNSANLNSIGEVTLNATAGDNEASVTYSVTGNLSLKSDGVTIVATGVATGNERVTATFGESTHYLQTISTQEITIVNEPMTIDKSAFAICDITSTTANVNLTEVLRNGGVTCNYDDVTYTFENDNTSDVAHVSNGELTSYRDGAYTLRFTASSPRCSSALGNQELTLAIPRGIMTFVTEGAWTNSECWSRPDITLNKAYHDVEISARCRIEDEVKADVGVITLNGELTIEAGGVLKAEEIRNERAENLILKADEDGSASVLFDNGAPKATVECWLRGKSKWEEATNGHHIATPEWQYRGFVGCPDETGWRVNQVLVYAWDEQSDGWVESHVTQGEPWKGYSMANIDTVSKAVSYTTTLVPTNAAHDTLMSRTGSGTKCGLNLFTNSFSAPVRISDIGFADEAAYKEIVFFKTKSHDGVARTIESDSTQDEKMTSVYVTCPLNTSEVAGVTEVPSGGSFFCFTTTGNERITMPEPMDVASGAMYEPRREEFNVLTIYAESEGESDRVIMVESESCSHGYDNGYDGTKYFTTGVCQVYGSNDFGRTFITADSSMLGQMIGFRAGGADVRYRLRFGTERLSGYDELYVYDRVTRRYVDVLGDERYEFSGTTECEDERFQIVGRRSDGSSYVTGRDHVIEVIGERVLLRGFDGEDRVVWLSDMQGHVVWQDNAKRGPWFDLPALVPGLYVIHCGDATAKYLCK